VAIPTQMININLRWYMLLQLPSQDSCRETGFAAATHVWRCTGLPAVRRCSKPMLTSTSRWRRAAVAGFMWPLAHVPRGQPVKVVPRLQAEAGPHVRHHWNVFGAGQVLKPNHDPRYEVLVVRAFTCTSQSSPMLIDS